MALYACAAAAAAVPLFMLLVQALNLPIVWVEFVLWPWVGRQMC